MPLRWRRTARWDREIAALDAKEDAQEIVTILVSHVFPVELLLALELAQLRTFTIPSISKVLHATRQYEDDGVRRLDDTRAIIGEIYRYERGSVEQREMIEHLNAIHSLYTISNDDYLYTLSTFIFDPTLFLERFGFRSLTDKEQDAVFHMYRELGEQMGIESLPETRHDYWRWRVAYEARAQRYSPANEAVARGFLAAVRSLLPTYLQPFTEMLTTAVLDDEQATLALGLDLPPRAVVRAVRNGLWLQARAARFLNPFESRGIEEWAFFNTFPSYPDGYERLRLGPRRVMEILDRRRERQAS